MPDSHNLLVRKKKGGIVVRRIDGDQSILPSKPLGESTRIGWGLSEDRARKEGEGEKKPFGSSIPASFNERRGQFMGVAFIETTELPLTRSMSFHGSPVLRKFRKGKEERRGRGETIGQSERKVLGAKSNRVIRGTHYSRPRDISSGKKGGVTCRTRSFLREKRRPKPDGEKLALKNSFIKSNAGGKKGGR